MMHPNHPPAPFTLTPIGVVRSVFKKKFGIPRQPGLVEGAKGIIELTPPFGNEQTTRGLDGFSHIWVIFLFHDALTDGWRPMVRPPRLGGKKRVGVFASRSPIRPNPIGLSCLELEKIETEKGKTRIHVKGLDILDGTPVIDIKPYLPYSDALSSATGGYAAEAPEKKFDVVFSTEALTAVESMKEKADFLKLVTELIAQDPRPGFYRPEHVRSFFLLHLGDEEVKWRLEGETATVISIEKTGLD